MARAARSKPTSKPSPASATNEGDKSKEAVDPIKGMEVSILTSLLGDPQSPASLIASARRGDGPSLDRVIKIFDLRRRYRLAEQAAEGTEED